MVVDEGMNISINMMLSWKKHTNIKKHLNLKNKHIIEEAMNSPLGYTMPYDGVFEILNDMVFSFIKFREYERLYYT